MKRKSNHDVGKSPARAETGARASGAEQMLVLACGALAREIRDVIGLNGWTHVTLHCLPAKLHLHPEKIPDAVEKAVMEFRRDFNSIFIMYGDCGTGGLLKRRCDSLGVEMIEGPHCYSFFEGNSLFAKRSETETTAFYLTDFLVRQFDAFVWKPMGLDRHPELRDMLFGNYTKLVYIAQTEDPSLEAKAIECAERLGLEYERRFSGYGDLGKTLAAWAGGADEHGGRREMAGPPDGAFNAVAELDASREAGAGGVLPEEVPELDEALAAAPGESQLAKCSGDNEDWLIRSQVDAGDETFKAAFSDNTQAKDAYGGSDGPDKGGG